MRFLQSNVSAFCFLVLAGAACAPATCPDGHAWDLHVPKEGLPYFFCVQETDDDGKKCLKKGPLVSFCPLLEVLPRVPLPDLVVAIYMFGTMAQMVDTVHETRLSRATVAQIYTTLRQMLCDFMLMRNEHVCFSVGSESAIANCAGHAPDLAAKNQCFPLKQGLGPL